ncbi:MAG: GNAT family N-acetyltransferase, partial [Alphaproteobacteria bacterium]|nr:GNAT family N-acetyltransferase [Alphaproteobacteria bacterium]
AGAGSWFVDVVAVLPDFRGRGIGVRLLADARRRADAAGRKTLSLIVSDANAGARRLYERHGFRVMDSRPMVKEGWVNPGRNWILMTT